MFYFVFSTFRAFVIILLYSDRYSRCPSCFHVLIFGVPDEERAYHGYGRYHSRRDTETHIKTPLFDEITYKGGEDSARILHGGIVYTENRRAVTGGGLTHDKDLCYRHPHRHIQAQKKKDCIQAESQGDKF